MMESLQNAAIRLRIDSIRSTSAAGSGHPTSCCSAADLMAALFFSEMRFDPKDPHNPDSDRFVLSKGHAAPILYAAWAEAHSSSAHDRGRLEKWKLRNCAGLFYFLFRVSFPTGVSIVREILLNQSLNK